MHEAGDEKERMGFDHHSFGVGVLIQGQLRRITDVCYNIIH